MGWKGFLLGGPVGWLIEEAVDAVDSLKQPEASNHFEAQFGDIVGVSRGIYDHYGIFISNGSVIHYSSHNSDVGDNKVIETTFRRFLRDSDNYFVLDFKGDLYEPSSTPMRHQAIMPLPKLPTSSVQTLAYREDFSPSETVKRARSRLGEDSYSLLLNNCEHFAIWCKTGASESSQVDTILAGVKRVALSHSWYSGA